MATAIKPRLVEVVPVGRENNGNGKHSRKSAPVHAIAKREYPNAYVTHHAHSDTGMQVDVEIYRQVDHNERDYAEPADPLVQIRIERLHGSLFGNPDCDAVEVPDIRMSQVEDLIRGLEATLKAARSVGMLPPPLSWQERRELDERRRQRVEASSH